MGSPSQSPIINPGRGMMKVYVARDYLDWTYRVTNTVQVNLPEYVPTIPQDDKFTEIPVDADYFVNENYPVTQDIIKSVHCLDLPILKGTPAPVKMKKGAEYMLVYPTGKIEEGYLVFIRHKEDIEEDGDNS